MAETTEALADEFKRSGREQFASSPLYRRLCRVVAQEDELLGLLMRRRSGQVPTFLLFGAVHDLLLRGTDHPLREWYADLVPSARDPRVVGPVFVDFCHDHWADLEELVSTRLVQTNVVKRSWAIRIALASIADEVAGPIHLVEVGSSAGLLLAFDHYSYVVGDQVWGDPDSPVRLETEWRGPAPPDLDRLPEVATRVGVDLHPVDVADPDLRRWLEALVWPEDAHKRELLVAALDLVPSDPPPLLAGDIIDLAPQLRERLPVGETRVVFHVATRMHVPAERRADFDAAIDLLGDDGPLFHVWVEAESAHHTGLDAVDGLSLHGPDRRLRRIAMVEGHLEWVAPLFPSPD